MTDLTLYGHPDSGHACKVALALSLADIPFQSVWVDIWAEPESRPEAFLAASPFAEVPLLLIDGIPHVQSGAILLEIATKFQCLGGKNATNMQRGRELLMWEANRIGMCLPQLKEARRVKGQGFPPGSPYGVHQQFPVGRGYFPAIAGESAVRHLRCGAGAQ